MKSPNPLRLTLEGLFEKTGADALWITNLKTIQYLAGFTGSTAELLITKELKKYMLVDSRYWEQTKIECPDSVMVPIKRPPIPSLIEHVKDLGIKTLAFEGGEVSYANHKKVASELEELSFVGIEENLQLLRVCKSEDEIAKLKAANKIHNQAFEEFLKEMHLGWTEKEAAWFMEKRFRELGGQALSFDTIVVSGPNTALVHGQPSDKAFKKGDFILVDRGLVAERFCTDETNTFVLGKATKKQKEIYQIVKDAHDKCIEAVKPGMSCAYIDSVARDYINEQGYGEYFGHGTGHGVGIEVHEEPRISPLGKGWVEEGMVFSIEPGIYIPDFGGVRIEDIVLVTADGCEMLTLADKSLLELEVD